jgi:cytochrome c biogenesis protein CcmG, thiol:disulfide interchange protein DsbE
MKNIAAAFSILLFFVLSCGSVEKKDDTTSSSGSFSFSLDTVDGDQFSFSDLKGEKHLLIAFWATWCEPCKTELKKLSEMYPEYSEKVEFIAVSTDTEESLDKVSMFVVENSLPFPVLIDPSGNTVSTMIPGGETVPYTILVSKEGEVVARHTGYKPGEEEVLKREIEELLKK